jgi:hypothetical protein
MSVLAETLCDVLDKPQTKCLLKAAILCATLAIVRSTAFDCGSLKTVPFHPA